MEKLIKGILGSTNNLPEEPFEMNEISNEDFKNLDYSILGIPVVYTVWSDNSISFWPRYNKEIGLKFCWKRIERNKTQVKASVNVHFI